MELKDIMLDENQHRLLMCCRMAQALGQGDIFLDATGYRLCWRMERKGKATNVFYSIDEMECYLEHLLENRWRVGVLGKCATDAEVKRRLDIIKERHSSRTSGERMTLFSRANRQGL